MHTFLCEVDDRQLLPRLIHKTGLNIFSEKKFIFFSAFPPFLLTRFKRHFRKSKICDADKKAWKVFAKRRNTHLFCPPTTPQCPTTTNQLRIGVVPRLGSERVWKNPAHSMLLTLERCIFFVSHKILKMALIRASQNNGQVKKTPRKKFTTSFPPKYDLILEGGQMRFAKHGLDSALNFFKEVFHSETHQECLAWQRTPDLFAKNTTHQSYNDASSKIPKIRTWTNKNIFLCICIFFCFLKSYLTIISALSTKFFWFQNLQMSIFWVTGKLRTLFVDWI